jgi:ubiquinone/menaquinone biosynthesis C-methylase UbiE
MTNEKNRVCPVEHAGSLDNSIRRWLQNPRKILEAYIEEGMTVLDIGCGPGFFTIAMAQMVGKAGRVIACDLQEGMLQKLRDKIQGTELGRRTALRRCEANRVGVREKVDFILAFYVVHEVQNQRELFMEIGSILNPKGRVLVVEPPFHVSKRGFEETIGKAGQAGLAVVGRPKVFFSRAAILEMPHQA